MDSKESKVVRGRVNERIIININKNSSHNRILIGTPTRGIFRAEWAQARYGQIIPTNWTAAMTMLGYTHMMPLGYLVADAQNIIVETAVKDNFEWVLLHEDDVVLPIDAFLRINEYMKKGDIPVVSGLYFLKSAPLTEPLVYRGRGNSCYSKFNMGDLVWADGVPTGCLLMHGSILKLMYDESPDYQTSSGHITKKVFETPAKVWYDPEKMTQMSATGTSDLYWCDRVMKEKVLERTGWKKIAKRKFPYLVDTNIFCRHIDMNTGTQYPLALDSIGRVS